MKLEPLGPSIFKFAGPPKLPLNCTSICPFARHRFLLAGNSPKTCAFAQASVEKQFTTTVWVAQVVLSGFPLTPACLAQTVNVCVPLGSTVEQDPSAVFRRPAKFHPPPVATLPPAIPGKSRQAA
jgi:hypothetical protein